MLRKDSTGSLSAARLVTRYSVSSLASWPLCRCRQPICPAPARPSCAGSTSRLASARRSRRLRLSSIFTTWGGNALRQEVLGGFQKALLIASQRQQVIGSFVVENLRHGFVLRVQRVQADHLAGKNRRALNQFLRGGNFVALVGHRFDAQATVGRQTDR